MADTLVYAPYNKKSLVIRGDRNKYGTMIKNLGGRWNPKLLEGGVGWIFPRSREVELKKLIDSLNQDKLSEMKNHAKSRKGQLKYHRAISEEESESEDDEESENDDEGEKEESESEADEENEENEESQESENNERFEKLRKKKHKKVESLEKLRSKKKKQVLREVKKKPKQKEKKTLKNRKHSGRTTHRHSDRFNGFDKELDYYRRFSKKSKKTRSDSESESDSNYSESESESESESGFSSDSSGFPSYENSPRRQKKKSHAPSIEDRFNVLQRRVWELEMDKKRR